ncbi:hypothetical protein ACJ73_07823 [Blastomyces percursus]|uniref:Uncharacterized protein n=1 Tax=Blastomyces percursus TaxID=1658174 RepID=A0A1J9PY60_9EURO|nr:hypothetical protein ACJ73_07823 [Blastomyces percursus]
METDRSSCLVVDELVRASADIDYESSRSSKLTTPYFEATVAVRSLVEYGMFPLLKFEGLAI